MAARPTSTPSGRGLVAGLAGTAMVGLLALAGCSDDVDSGRHLPSEALEPGEDLEGTLGRVHVILQPQPGALEPEPQLQISGRFVEYRGVSEAFVRARANLPVAPWDQLVPGQCVPRESLLPPAEVGPGDEFARELSMIDAGDLRVTLGNREVVAPLTLVPDILPWLAGVEYLHVDDRLPRMAVEPDGTAPVLVAIDGAPEAGLPALQATALVPEAMQLGRARVDDARLTVSWRPPGDRDENIVLHLQGFAADGDGSEPVGDELTCLVSDSGRANLALGPLREAGLAIDAGLLRVSASRFDHAKVPAGEFGEVEILVELRAIEILDLRPPSRLGFE